MHSKLIFGISTVAIGSLLAFWCIRPSKKQIKVKADVLRLIDNGIDRLWSVMDLISPKPNAFDKPQEICNFIKSAPQDIPIKLIIQTRGGDLSACEKMLKKLLRHPKGYIAYIRNECFSAGTILALGAQEIVMTEDSYLGKIDPQLSSMLSAYPAVLYATLEKEYINADNIDKVKLSIQTLNYMKLLLDRIFKNNLILKSAVEKEMIYADLPHYKTFSIENCQAMGLNVRLPTEEEKQYFD